MFFGRIKYRVTLLNRREQSENKSQSRVMFQQSILEIKCINPFSVFITLASTSPEHLGDLRKTIGNIVIEVVGKF